MNHRRVYTKILSVVISGGQTVHEMFTSFYLSVFSIMINIILYAKSLGKSALKRRGGWDQETISLPFSLISDM